MTSNTTHETQGFVLGKKFLLNSVKAMGMTLESAISELIDNSIGAGASEIIVRKTKQELQFDDGNTMFTYTISDNGRGMITEKLAECVSTFGYHEEYDLGAISHYGVGMKIALLFLSNGGEIKIVSRHEGILSEVRISTSVDTPEGEEILIFPPKQTSQPNGTTIVIPNVVDTNNNSKLLTFLGTTYYPKWCKDNNFRIVLWAGVNDEEHSVIFTDPMYRHLVDSNKVNRLSFECYVGESLINIHGFILDEDRFTDSDYSNFDNRRDSSNGRKLVLSRAGIYLRLENRYITLGNGYFPGYVPQHYYNGCRIEVEVPKDSFEAFGIQINKSKCDIDITRPILKNFTNSYKTITQELQRKLKKNTFNKTEVEMLRIEEDSTKMNGVLKKGRLKNPLENPRIKELVPETTRETKLPQSTKNRPNGLSYVKKDEVFQYDEINLGERDFFYYIERRDMVTLLIVNKDHPWYQKFIQMENDSRYLIVTTLFSQYYSFLEILNNNEMFDPTTFNIVLDDFWRSQTDYLRRIYAL